MAQLENVSVLPETPLVRALFTAIRDKDASRHSFVTKSDRLVQMLLEAALGLLPAEAVTVQTPCGPYEGVRLPPEERICAVSILRAADCMLGVARSMMPSIAVPLCRPKPHLASPNTVPRTCGLPDSDWTPFVAGGQDPDSA